MSAPIYVVDDGSSDHSGGLARRFGCVVLATAGIGAAGARNVGISAACADVLLFTDADCIPAPTWIAEMTVPFDAPAVVATRGVYTSRQRNIVARFVQADYEDRYRRLTRGQDIDFVDTYSAGYRRQVLLDVGGFDESYPGSSVEDQELSFRLAAARVRMVFTPSASVEHVHPESIVAYWRKKVRIGYYKVRVLRVHPARLHGDNHTPGVVRFQTLLAGATLAMVLPGLLVPRIRRTLGATIMILMLSGTPLAVRVSRRDRTLGAVVPLLVFLRSTGLAAGLWVGLFAWLAGLEPMAESQTGAARLLCEPDAASGHAGTAGPRSR